MHIIGVVVLLPLRLRLYGYTSTLPTACPPVPTKVSVSAKLVRQVAAKRTASKASATCFKRIKVSCGSLHMLHGAGKGESDSQDSSLCLHVSGTFRRSWRALLPTPSCLGFVQLVLT